METRFAETCHSNGACQTQWLPSASGFEIKDDLLFVSNVACSSLAYPQRNDDGKDACNVEDQDYDLNKRESPC